VQAYPNRGTFRAVLGLAQWRSGDVPAAVQDLEQSLALGAGANEGMCCFTLAMAHEKLGNPEAARAWFDRGERWLKALPNVTGADAIREQTRRFQSEAAARLGSGP
jgi:hypothetical protein